MKLQKNEVTGTDANNTKQSHVGAKWNFWMLCLKQAHKQKIIMKSRKYIKPHKTRTWQATYI